MAPTTAPNTGLDADELLHLAILDTQAGRHDAAIAKLKNAAEQAPGNGKIHYLLAAEHAEIGLYDRAIEGMKRAVQLDTGLDTAHLQLGLLYFTQGRAQEAEAAWAKLDKLGPDDSLHLFKTALLTLHAGDTAGCIRLLERAAANVRGNPALANDIQRMLANLRRQADPKAAAATPAAHLLATRYGDPGNDAR